MDTNETLKTGTQYNLDQLVFLGWSTGKTNEPGYYCWDYFDEDGIYLGPDQYGVEPLFAPRSSFGIN